MRFPESEYYSSLLAMLEQLRLQQWERMRDTYDARPAELKDRITQQCELHAQTCMATVDLMKLLEALRTQVAVQEEEEEA